MECAVGRFNEPVEGVPRLLDALLGKHPHLGGNIEAIGAGHARLLLSPGMDCHAVGVMRPHDDQRANRALAPAKAADWDGSDGSTLTGIHRCVSSISANARSP